MTNKTRRQRRQEARESGTPFQPNYSKGYREADDGSKYQVGGDPQTYVETFGVGYERFDDKYTKVSELIGEI